MTNAAPLLFKLILAIAGAKALHMSYGRYRARRRDPSQAADPTDDAWWRVLVWGATAVATVLVLMLVLHNTVRIPEWAVDAFTVVLAAGVLAVFAAAFALGWRNASKKYRL